MTTVEFLNPPSLGPAIAPYSQGAVAGGLVHLAGQVALASDGTVVGEGDIRAQTAHVLERVRTVLAERGLDLPDIIMATVYLVNRDDYAGLNEVWSREFGGHRPVRSLVVADLVKPGLLIEVQATAADRR